MAKRKAQSRTLRKETISRRAAQAESERRLRVFSATYLFSSRGYHETSIRDVAEHAGFSIGALYQRFESKDALYCEVVETHFGSIWSALDRAVAEHETFEARLGALTGAIFNHVSTNKTSLRVYERHPSRVAEPYQSKITNYRGIERSRRTIVEASRRGIATGRSARPTPPSPAPPITG